MRDQGQRVDVVPHQRLEHGVDHAVARHARLAVELRGDDFQAVMAAARSFGVTNVQSAFVEQLKRLWRERGQPVADLRFDRGGVHWCRRRPRDGRRIHR